MYYPVDSEVAAMRDLSGDAKLIHGYLCFIQGHDDHAYPKVGTIAKCCGIRARRASQAIRQLERAGLLKVLRRHGTSSRYQVQTTPISGGTVESGTTAGIDSTAESGVPPQSAGGSVDIDRGVVSKSTPHHPRNRHPIRVLPESLSEEGTEALLAAEKSALIPFGPEQDPVAKAVMDFFGGPQKVYASRFRVADDVADRIGPEVFIAGLAEAKLQGKRWDAAIAWIRERAKSAGRAKAWTETDEKRKGGNQADDITARTPGGKTFDEIRAERAEIFGSKE